MDRLAGAFRDAPIGMALVASRGGFRRVNATLCRLLGRTEEELLAASLPDVAEDRHVAEALRDGEPSLHIETPMRTATGARSSRSSAARSCATSAPSRCTTSASCST